MSTATMPPTTPLAETAQALIDARLDTIERMLLGQIPRADRLAIVREVEAQIHDHLAERSPDDTDRDAVIAALARLDPPEAYLPDETGAVVRPMASVRVSPSIVRDWTRELTDLPKSKTTSSLAAGILGMLSLACTVPLLILFYVMVGSNQIGNGLVYSVVLLNMLTILISALAIIFAGIGRVKGPWAITGISLGIACLMPALLAAAFMMNEFSG